MTCYILYSPSLDKHYIGVTTQSPEMRLTKHNKALYGSHFTSQAQDWEFFHLIVCQCTRQMLQIEKHIKRMKSKVYLENLKRYPEMTEKLRT